MDIAVSLRYPGVAAREIESLLTVPLEDGLADLPDLRSISSLSEDGHCRVYLRLAAADQRQAYDLVRSRVYAVHDGLPKAVQRPQFSSSGREGQAVWVGALRPGPLFNSAADGASGLDFASWLEAQLKPAVEAMPGVAEVELGGSAMTDLYLVLDGQGLAASGPALGLLGGLSQYDRRQSAGSLSLGGSRISLWYEGVLEDCSLLLLHALPQIQTSLAAMNTAMLRLPREADSLARLDGWPVYSLAVYAEAGTNLIALSAGLAARLASLSGQELEYKSLLDVGLERAQAYRSTLRAAAIGAAAVALASLGLLLVRRGPVPVLAVLPLAALAVGAVPLILLLSAASLAILGLGLDAMSLAGLAAGLGTAVDASLLSFDCILRLPAGRAADTAASRLAGLRPAIVANCGSSLVALLPLAGLGRLSPEGGRLVLAMAVSQAVAAALALALLPPLLYALRPGRASPAGTLHRGDRPPRRRRTVKAAGPRLLARLARGLGRRPWLPLAGCGLLVCLGGLCLRSLPKDTASVQDRAGLQLQLEFEPGLAAAEVDLRLADWASMLAADPGIDHVQTVARIGSAQAYLALNDGPAGRRDWAAFLQANRPYRSSLWLRHAGQQERLWQVAIRGDDDRLCRELATRLAQRCQNLPEVSRVALNFKPGPPALVLRPDWQRLALAGLSLGQLATILRWQTHAPVAWKRLEAGRETDVRLWLSQGPDRGRLPDFPPDRASLESSWLATPSGSLPLAQLAVIDSDMPTDRILRIQGRRSAGISLACGPLDPLRLEARVRALAAEIGLPAGYALDFDPEAIEAYRRLRSAWTVYALAAFLVWLFLSALGESWLAACHQLLVLPPAMAGALIVVRLLGWPLSENLLYAGIAVAGQAVSAAVLVHSHLGGAACRLGSRGLYRLYRRLGPLLGATVLTSVLGSLPLLWLEASQAALLRGIAVLSISALSLAALASLLVLPAVSLSGTAIRSRLRLAAPSIQPSLQGGIHEPSPRP